MFFANLKEDIRTIREKDPAARSLWEVLTCYPGLHALCFHRVAHAFWLNRFYWLARFISHFSRWLTGIEIHPAAVVGRRVFIDHGMGVVIGETAQIGDDCTIYQGVTLGGTSLARGAKRHPTLEAGVIVGAGAKILGGFSIGAGAKIGSNAVVVKPVPAGATAVGNPAHIVGNRDAAARQEFSAYGLTSADNDPIAQALNKLLAHLEKSEEDYRDMRARLVQAGIDCGSTQQAKNAEEIAHIRDLLNK